MEFKVSAQVKSQDRLDEHSIAYKLGLALTESVCNLKSYLKLVQVDHDSQKARLLK